MAQIQTRRSADKETFSFHRSRTRSAASPRKPIRAFYRSAAQFELMLVFRTTVKAVPVVPRSVSSFRIAGEEARQRTLSRSGAHRSPVTTIEPDVVPSGSSMVQLQGILVAALAFLVEEVIGPVGNKRLAANVC